MSKDIFLKKQAEKIGKRRTEIHCGQASQTLRGKKTDEIAMKGEFFFGMATGYMPDLKERVSGDRGYDFIIPWIVTIDVKTSRDGGALLHKKGSKMADLFVLVHYIESIDCCEFVGWTTRRVVLSKEPRDTGCGIINHEVLANELKPMKSLFRRLFHSNRLHYATRYEREKDASKNN